MVRGNHVNGILPAEALIRIDPPGDFSWLRAVRGHITTHSIVMGENRGRV